MWPPSGFFTDSLLLMLSRLFHLSPELSAPRLNISNSIVAVWKAFFGIGKSWQSFKNSDAQSVKIHFKWWPPASGRQGRATSRYLGSSRKSAIFSLLHVAFVLFSQSLHTEYRVSGGPFTLWFPSCQPHLAAFPSRWTCHVIKHLEVCTSAPLTRWAPRRIGRSQRSDFAARNSINFPWVHGN